jgi:hypothetical protein
MALNANKRSLTLDLTKLKAAEIVRRLAERADVSHSAKPARVGPMSSWPVIDMIPDIACILPSKAAVCRSGPV